jgi:hypothetical protein
MAAAARPGLFARKPTDVLVQETRADPEHGLKRTVGVLDLTALGIGAVIGLRPHALASAARRGAAADAGGGGRVGPHPEGAYVRFLRWRTNTRPCRMTVSCRIWRLVILPGRRAR